jgi:cell division protein FtsB
MTFEERLQQTLGQLTFQMVSLMTELEKTRNENAELKQQLEKLNGRDKQSTYGVS